MLPTSNLRNRAFELATSGSSISFVGHFDITQFRRGYVPVDMIELKYEATADGNISFLLKEESVSFGSRPAGTPVRKKLKNLVGFLEGNRVVVDFSDIHLVSSSFADEVFGKLFLELGPVEFSTKLELKNIDPIVKLLVEKAIIQRMASGK